MKKADNFDAKQWLVENKITTQSRLNEAKLSLADEGFNSAIEWFIKELTGQKWTGEPITFKGTIRPNVVKYAIDLELGREYDDSNDTKPGSNTYSNAGDPDGFSDRVAEMATLIKKNSPFGSEKPLQVGDTIMWNKLDYSNDRGMGPSVSGKIIGKVVKILGSANLQAEDIKTGDLYKISRKELTRIPSEEDKIEATLSYNYGAGSGSQGSNNLSGIVKRVNLENMTLVLQTEESDKPLKVKISDLQNVKIY